MISAKFVFVFPFLVLLTHYLTTMFYTSYCVKPGLWGFVEGIFTVASPTCNFTLTVMKKTSDLYASFWLYAISWIWSLFLAYFNIKK